jgi:hypothetical protein
VDEKSSGQDKNEGAMDRAKGRIKGGRRCVWCGKILALEGPEQQAAGSTTDDGGKKAKPLVTKVLQ